MRQLNTILLIDDDDTTNYLNQRLLSRAVTDATIRVVKNGEEALQYLRSAASQTPDFPRPDLILVDIKMSVMDGFEFLEEYEKLENNLKDNIVLLMLTSSASFYDLEKLKQFPSVLKHYAKPLADADVREIVQKYFS
ncbi:response regulator [Pontibacter arcticus]|uniref:Response regulator n=1 Tax=Pontibacter arcticus TaxID=2080288 RepID=A0A364RIB7_9BACT|nr:response regulator [Pontibacter arcticus]RAU84014.1 response regulator [Pontibacter arcticus]